MLLREIFPFPTGRGVCFWGFLGWKRRIDRVLRVLERFVAVESVSETTSNVRTPADGNGEVFPREQEQDSFAETLKAAGLGRGHTVPPGFGFFEPCSLNFILQQGCSSVSFRALYDVDRKDSGSRCR